jgi:glutathione S-transferase-like protein
VLCSGRTAPHPAHWRSIFGVMNLGLFNKRYLAADQYTIADVICYPWASSWATRKIDIDEFPNVKRRMEKSASGRPSRKRWPWGRSSGRIRLRSAPRSRPAAEKSLQTSGRSNRRPRSHGMGTADISYAVVRPKWGVAAFLTSDCKSNGFATTGLA